MIYLFFFLLNFSVDDKEFRTANLQSKKWIQVEYLQMKIPKRLTFTWSPCLCHCFHFHTILNIEIIDQWRAHGNKYHVWASIINFIRLVEINTSTTISIFEIDWIIFVSPRFFFFLLSLLSMDGWSNMVINWSNNWKWHRVKFQPGSWGRFNRFAAGINDKSFVIQQLLIGFMWILIRFPVRSNPSEPFDSTTSPTNQMTPNLFKLIE